MKHVFELSDQTIKVVNGHATELAEEAGVGNKYIYAILANRETDPFAKFEHYYTAACRARLDVSPWDNRLAVIRSRYQQTDTLYLPLEAAKLVEETADVAIAVLTDKTPEQNLKEATEALRQAEKTYQAAIDAINQSNGHTSDAARVATNGLTKAWRAK